MKSDNPFNKECSVYPGEYVPMPEIEFLIQELNALEKDPATQPLINMDEFNDCYKMEIAIPGAKREDIFIHLHDNILSLVVRHKYSETLKKKWQIHEFDNECFERHILLPKEADPEFMHAEYCQGILNIYISKAAFPSITNNNQIAVY